MSKDIEWGFIHGEGDIICECDQCGANEVYEFENGPDFSGCQEYLKENGWVSRKIDGEWHDFCCQECLQKFLKEVGK